jgi:hypothetical protein
MNRQGRLWGGKFTDEFLLWVPPRFACWFRWLSRQSLPSSRRRSPRKKRCRGWCSWTRERRGRSCCESCWRNRPPPSSRPGQPAADRKQHLSAISPIFYSLFLQVTRFNSAVLEQQTLILWGDKDQVFPIDLGYRLQR